MNEIDFLYLSENDMIQAGVSNVKCCLSTMEDMFFLLHKGDYRMGGENANEHGIRVSFPEKSDILDMPLHAPDYRFMAMPAYLGGRFHMVGVKTYGSHNSNKQKGLPRSILMMTLMDVDTGVPVAYMSANILSAMRTAATAGIGVKYLSKKDPVSLGIIGPGVISRYTLDTIIELEPSIKTVKIKGRGEASIKQFISYASNKYPKLKIIVCDTIKDTCIDSDIVYFCTTNAAKFEDNPRIKKEWINDGALVISASSLLLESDVLTNTDVKLVADNYKMYEDWGTGNKLPTQKNVSTLLGMAFFDAVSENRLKRDDIIDIGDIITKNSVGRDNEKQIIIYAVGGMPIEDVAWACDCYKNAVEIGVGTKLCLWKESKL